MNPIPPPYFQWVIENRLAAFAFPSKPEHIAFLLQNNIRTLVSLQEYPDPPVRQFPTLNWRKIPVREFHPPTLAQICQFVDVAETAINDGQAVGVHCTFGRGRTGVMIAAYFVYKFRLSAVEAIERLRRIRPYSVETSEQEDIVQTYEEYVTENPPKV